jgi:chromosomal replication initiation ATPase DnaA
VNTRLHPQFRFETFVVGAGNRLAATAARAVAESPGAAYNPLFVYSAPGLGKTHLLMAIGHAALAVDPGLAVEYVTLDEFVEAYHAAVAAGQGDAVRRRYADTGLLLLDDVQFLSERRELQAELLRVVDGMQTAGRQIVLASDRPPAEMEALDERLLRRFAGGLVIDVGAPDFETRLAILRRKAEERRATLPPAVLEAIARLPIDNVRELAGALNRVIAQQAVAEGPLDAAQVRSLFGPQDAPAEIAAVVPAVAPSPADEFGDFLSEVSATLSRQVEGWRARIAEAMLRWDGEGYRVRRLEALLDGEMADPADALRRFEADVEALRACEAEAVALDPSAGGDAAFRDPDQLDAARAAVARVREGVMPPPAPSPHWRLEDVVAVAGNEVALHAARTVAAEPGRRYNPLVLAGPSGTGKTHLLHGIGNVLAAAPGAVVACLSAHDLVAELVEALEQGRVAAWQARYRRADALLLDDVHLLAGKERTQEELFHLFNLLVEQERQMVFTTAEPLAAVEGLEPRLRTRLEGGLVAELQPADRELRRRVTDRLLAARGEAPAPELAAYLAARPAGSVRAVQGVVQRLLNAAEVQQRPLDLALARELLEGPPPPPPAPPPVRSSGVVRPGAGGLRSPEKLVWEWPEPAELALEEYR